MEADHSVLEAMGIFMPYAHARIVDVVQNGRRFVHYTSAEAAMSIIQNREVWMRSTTLMNDIFEIDHGIDCLVKAYQSEDVGGPLKGLLESLYPGFVKEFEQLFDPWIEHFRADTYIMCLSEHEASEDVDGRLSMWRAYGGRNGVAMVINNTPFVASTDALKAYSSPVAYLTKDEFKKEFAKIAGEISNNLEVVSRMGRADCAGYLFAAFRFAAICAKHPGFREEREWRVVYAPTIEKSTVIRSGIKSINGVAQIVQMLPLQNDPNNGLIGADIPNILERLIIGPCEHPRAAYRAFVAILEEAGVPDAASKVAISGIPLRQ